MQDAFFRCIVAAAREILFGIGIRGKRLKEQVKELTKDEYIVLRSQNATLSQEAHSKYLPYAFTEHGVLNLRNLDHTSAFDERAMRISSLEN